MMKLVFSLCVLSLIAAPARGEEVEVGVFGMFQNVLSTATVKDWKASNVVKNVVGIGRNVASQIADGAASAANNGALKTAAAMASTAGETAATMASAAGKTAATMASAAGETAATMATTAGETAATLATTAGESAVTMAATAGETAATLATTAGQTANTVGQATKGTATKVMQMAGLQLKDLEEKLRSIPEERAGQIAKIIVNKLEDLLRASLLLWQLEFHLTLGLLGGLVLPWIGLVFCPFLGVKHEAWLTLGFNFGLISTLISGGCIILREANFANQLAAFYSLVGIESLYYAACGYLATVLLAASALTFAQQRSGSGSGSGNASSCAGTDDANLPQQPPRTASPGSGGDPGGDGAGGDGAGSTDQLLAKLHSMDVDHKQLMAKVMEKVGLLETKLETLTEEAGTRAASLSTWQHAVTKRLQWENEALANEALANETTEVPDGIKTPPEQSPRKLTELQRSASEDVDQLYCSQYVMLGAEEDEAPA